MIQNRSIPSMVEELAFYLSKYQLNNALITIGKVGSLISSSDLTPITSISEDSEERPLYMGPGALAYLALRLIENADDSNEERFSHTDLERAIAMYGGLPEYASPEHRGLVSILRFHNAQFVFEHPLGYILARTLILYRDLWHLHPEISELDIDSAIAEISGGLTLEEVLILGMHFWKHTEGNEGYIRFTPYWLNASFRILPFIRRDGTIIEPEKVSSFLQWIAADYSTIRDIAKNQLKDLAHPDLEKYRFNPLVTYPIIIPYRNPAGQLPLTFIAPLPHLIIYRVTLGLFFNLLEYFRKHNKGKFGKAFGKLWEEYVLLLLKHAAFQGTLEGERVYAGGSIKRPDAIVKENDTVVLIEDKASAIYSEAKKFGDPEMTKQNLKDTIAHAVEQLWSFEKDADSGIYPELLDIRSTPKRKRLIVIYDDISFANSFLRDLTVEALKEKDDGRKNKGEPALDIPIDFEFHVISITELENLCAIEGLSLYRLLEEKAGSSVSMEEEFSNYLSNRYPGIRNTFLDSVLEEFEAPLIQIVETLRRSGKID